MGLLYIVIRKRCILICCWIYRYGRFKEIIRFFFYNCLLKDFKLFKFTRFQTFFIIGRRKFLQKRKFSGLVSKFYLAMLLSLRPPIAKSLRACNNFWKCYTMRSILVLFRKQNPRDINQLVFEPEIQLVQKSFHRRWPGKCCESFRSNNNCLLKEERIGLEGEEFKFVRLFLLISL